MHDIEPELLDRYLAGQATAREREALEQWLAEDPDRVAWLQALGGALASLEDVITDGELASVWKRVAERSGIAETASEGVSRTEPPIARFEIGQARRPGWRLGLGLAATAVLAVSVALAGRALLTNSEENRGGAPERVVAVPRGQRAQLRLPDGTEVVLGAGSTLRHPRVFPDESREVRLEGEAYFTVAHEERRPFRVRAGDLVATQLGTEFLVRAYPENGGARVVVRSGSVAVRAAGTPDSARPGTTVRPGEMARLGRNGVQVEPADTAAYFAWIAGTLVFDGTPLREALPQLSRWYDLDFRLADSSLGAIPLSGRLDQTLTSARLDLLAASVGLAHERRGREVTFYRAPLAR